MRSTVTTYVSTDVETFQHRDVAFTLWDVGGCGKPYPYILPPNLLQHRLTTSHLTSLILSRQNSPPLETLLPEHPVHHLRRG